jgi:saccharopine dehydrogenase (NADP+, L-glutamate forming)
MGFLWLIQKTLLARISGAKSESEDDLIAAVVSKANIPTSEQQRIIAGLRFLDFFSSKPVKRESNLLDTLCAKMDEKMQYAENERDMVMLQHRFEIEWADGRKETRTSTGLWFGEVGGDSAMAQTG